MDRWIDSLIERDLDINIIQVLIGFKQKVYFVQIPFGMVLSSVITDFLALTWDGMHRK
jgi:hypothetical protein